ncbi:UNVERIFIED_ORG: hypothetical protein LHJ69_07225 [Shinella sp. XGS7]|nr:hypothetical protein [Shinella sp. XGS7]
MSTNTFYVKGQVDASGNFAEAAYYLDAACTQVAPQPLRIPKTAGVCRFVQSSESTLVLVGAVFKTLGQPPGLNNQNFAASNDESVVGIPMPTEVIVTKGVVLLFSSPGVVDSLYPTTDPEVKNDEQ